MVRAPKTAVGAYALCAVFLRHILRLLALLRKPLFATEKRQLPRTLNAIPAGGYIPIICYDTLIHQKRPRKAIYEVPISVLSRAYAYQHSLCIP